MTKVRMRQLPNGEIKGELLSAKKPAAEKPSPECFYTWEEYASLGNAGTQRRTRRSIHPARI
jgi:hypothetical protein